MLKVLVVGQTPPPYHGQSIMIERLVQAKMPGVKLIHVRMGFSSDINEVGRVRLSKLVHMATVTFRIIYHRLADDVRLLYYPPAGPDRVPMVRDIVILVATRWLFDKTVFHFHAGGLFELYSQLPTWLRWLFRRAYFSPDAAIRLSTLTPEDGRCLHTRREYVIPYGIDDPFLDPVDAPTAAQPDRDESLRILFVGTLSESKGLLDLIEACGKLAARGVPFRLAAMGQWHSDRFATRVHDRIQELNLGDHIEFLGVLTGKEKFAAYRRADVFGFPTFYNCEAFPVVLLEAMASGLPVVSTHWRGIPSIVDDGETGFLVDPHDPEAVADRLAELAADTALRQRMGARGRAKFGRRYTIHQHVRRMRNMFLETAGLPLVDEPERWSRTAAITTAI